ncbi:hypothetical protein DUZ99_13935 [Xylanibacillus composti]|nr:hypothetical protein [Xylanibacillus composti]
MGVFPLLDYGDRRLFLLIQVTLRQLSGQMRTAGADGECIRFRYRRELGDDIGQFPIQSKQEADRLWGKR